MAARAAVEPAGADLQLVHQRPSRGGQAAHPGLVFRISSHRPALLGHRAGWAGLHALAAAGAARGLAPRPVQLGDEPRLDAAAGDVPHVRAFDLGAGAHAARTQDAAVVVEHVARVRGVDREPRVVVRVAHVRDAVVLGQRL